MNVSFTPMLGWRQDAKVVNSNAKTSDWERRCCGSSSVSMSRWPEITKRRTLTYPAAFALATHHWRIAPTLALKGLLWVYVEGQVMAAIRLVPLGQTAGQRILIDAVEVIDRAGSASAINS